MSCRYLLDANIFVEAHRQHYPFDIFPSYWQWLITENSKESIASIDQVYEELCTGDLLYEWIKELSHDLWFYPVDDIETQTAYGEMVEWIESNTSYFRKAKDDFLSGADLWLIAKARALGVTLVTHERSHPDRKNRIFIPDICNQFRVNYITNIELMRYLEAKI